MGVTVREKVKGSGEYWIFINHLGKRKARKVGAKGAAKEVARRIQMRIAAKAFKVDDETIPTFGELAREWISLTVPATCKPATLREYQIILRKHVLPVFVKKPVDQITRLHVKDFLLSKGNAGFAASTVGHFKNVVSGVLSRAVEAEIIAHNPAQRLGRVVKPKDRKADIEPLTADEVNQLLEVFRDKYPHHFPMVLCLARTGMRFGEVRGLEWGDVDFRGGFIMVRRGMSRDKVETPKSGKGRRVDMSGQLAGVLHDLRTRRKREALAKGKGKMPDQVFLSPEGMPVQENNFRNRVWYKALAAAGLRKTRIHDLRHSYASLLIQNGEPLPYIRDQLGHSTIRLTVDTYGHLAPQGNRAAVDRLDNPALTPHLPATYTQPKPNKKGLAEANPLKNLERETGFEPATLSLEGSFGEATQPTEKAHLLVFARP